MISNRLFCSAVKLCGLFKILVLGLQHIHCLFQCFFIKQTLINLLPAARHGKGVFSLERSWYFSFSWELKFGNLPSVIFFFYSRAKAPGRLIQLPRWRIKCMMSWRLYIVSPTSLSGHRFWNLLGCFTSISLANLQCVKCCMQCCQILRDKLLTRSMKTRPK